MPSAVETSGTLNLERLMSDEAAKGLTIGQLGVLNMIAVGKYPRLTDIAIEAGVSRATLSSRLAALERRGFIQRVNDTKNRRLVRVKITRAGRQLLAKLRIEAEWPVKGWA